MKPYKDTYTTMDHNSYPQENQMDRNNLFGYGDHTGQQEQTTPQNRHLHHHPLVLLANTHPNLQHAHQSQFYQPDGNVVPHTSVDHHEPQSPTSSRRASGSVPLPPSLTSHSSASSGEMPKTLWMGDLDPNFKESTIELLWKSLGKTVKVKLIRAKKNLLIPCSTAPQPPTTTTSTDNPTTQYGQAQAHPGADGHMAGSVTINGSTFIDPNQTQLHHAGYCFVEFQSFAETQHALTLNSHPIPNIFDSDIGKYTNPDMKRTFRLNWASGATLQSIIPATPEYSLFVGDLAPDCYEQDLLSLFQQKYSSVKTVRVMTDPITGASRCFGFVRFSDLVERELAVSEMNGTWCKGRPLRVAYATPRASVHEQPSEMESLQMHHQQEQHFAPLSPIKPNEQHTQKVSNIVQIAPLPFQETGTQALGKPPEFNQGHSTGPQTTDNTSAMSKSTTVFIGGLNSKVDEFHLYAMFQPFGTIVQVKIPPNKGCGFVKFNKRSSAEAAIVGLQGFILKATGLPIRLSWGREAHAQPRGYPPSPSEFHQGQQLHPPVSYGGEPSSPNVPQLSSHPQGAETSMFFPVGNQITGVTTGISPSMNVVDPFAQQQGSSCWTNKNVLSMHLAPGNPNPNANPNLPPESEPKNPKSQQYSQNTSNQFPYPF